MNTLNIFHNEMVMKIIKANRLDREAKATMSTIEERAEKMITFLSLQDAFELKGRSYCTMSALILKMTLSNVETSKEALERLVVELDKLDKVFGGAK